MKDELTKLGSLQEIKKNDNGIILVRISTKNRISSITLNEIVLKTIVLKKISYFGSIFF